MTRQKLVAGSLVLAAGIIPLAYQTGGAARHAASTVLPNPAPAAGDATGISTLAGSDPAIRSAPARARTRLLERRGGFEENRGQAPLPTQFFWRSAAASLFFTGPDAIISFGGRPGKSGDPAAVLRMRLVGASKDVRVEGRQPTGELANYYRGNDSDKWVTGVRKYARIAARGVYPGIDMIWYEKNGLLEYDFRLAPGADPDLISLHLQGKGKASIDARGDLVWRQGKSAVRYGRPKIYQDSNQGRRRVQGHYVLSRKNVVSFSIGRFDRSKPLVIDPVLSFSTLSGGGAEDFGFGVTLDPQKNVYIAGKTNSSAQFPGIDGGASGGYDAFVTKIPSDGSPPVSAYVGGESDDAAYGVAIGEDGSVLLAGETGSTDLPCGDGFQCNLKGNGDAFVTKLDSGLEIDRSVLFGGSGVEAALGVAVGPGGTVNITGQTGSHNDPSQLPSTDLPTEGGAYDSQCGADESSDNEPDDCSPDQETEECPEYKACSDGFFAAFESDLSRRTYSTYLGGAGPDLGMAIAADGSARYAWTWSDPPAGSAESGSPELVLYKFNATNGFEWSRSFAGDDSPPSPAGKAGAPSLGNSVSLDPEGNVYLTGRTKGLGTLKDGFQEKDPSGTTPAAFLLKLAPNEGAVKYGSYLASRHSPLVGDTGSSVVAGSGGRAYVAGWTGAADFPVKYPLQANHSNPCTGSPVDCLDGFVALFDTTRAGDASLMYSTFLGAAGALDAVAGLAIDPAGNAYVTGSSEANVRPPSTFPLTPDAYQKDGRGNADAFAAKIVPLTILSIQPKSGLVCGGDPVTIKGFGLKETTGVKFGNVKVAPSSVTDEEVVVTAPASPPGPVRIWPVTPDVPEPPDPARHLASQGTAEALFTYLPATAPCVADPPAPPPTGPAPGTNTPLQQGSDNTLRQLPPGSGPPGGPAGGQAPPNLISSQNAPSTPPPGGSGRPPVVAPEVFGAPGPVSGTAQGFAPSAASASSPLVSGAAPERPEQAPVPVPQFYMTGRSWQAPSPLWPAGIALVFCCLIAALRRSTGTPDEDALPDLNRPAPCYAA